MKKDRLYSLPTALPPVLPPAERWQFERPIPSLPVRISQDEIRRVLRSQTRAYLRYRAEGPRPVHPRQNTLCVI
jgi:hypothetical protein